MSLFLIDMTSYRFLHRPFVDDLFIVPLLTMYSFCTISLCLFDVVCVLIDMTSYRFLHRPFVDDCFIIPLLTMFFLLHLFHIAFSMSFFALMLAKHFCLSPHDV